MEDYNRIPRYECSYTQQMPQLQNTYPHPYFPNDNCNVSSYNGFHGTYKDGYNQQQCLTRDYGMEPSPVESMTNLNEGIIKKLSNCVKSEHENETNFSDNENCQLSHPVYPWMQNRNSGDDSSKKRVRQSYTRYQTFQLEQEFLMNRYLTKRRRLDLASSISLTERQVKIWFQNRRMKWKKSVNGVDMF